jgi:hypothetical protein
MKMKNKNTSDQENLKERTTEQLPYPEEKITE